MLYALFDFNISSLDLHKLKSQAITFFLEWSDIINLT